jgi:hypothetical protein
MNTRAPVVPEYRHQSFVLLPGTKWPELYPISDGVLPMRVPVTVKFGAAAPATSKFQYTTVRKIPLTNLQIRWSRP